MKGKQIIVFSLFLSILAFSCSVFPLCFGANYFAGVKVGDGVAYAVNMPDWLPEIVGVQLDILNVTAKTKVYFTATYFLENGSVIAPKLVTETMNITITDNSPNITTALENTFSGFGQQWTSYRMVENVTESYNVTSYSPYGYGPPTVKLVNRTTTVYNVTYQTIFPLLSQNVEYGYVTVYQSDIGFPVYNQIFTAISLRKGVALNRGSSMYVTDTQYRIYFGAIRNTIHIQYVDIGVKIDWWWDQATGILLEMQYAFATSTGTLEGNVKIAATNIWESNPAITYVIEPIVWFLCSKIFYGSLFAYIIFFTIIEVRDRRQRGQMRMGQYAGWAILLLIIFIIAALIYAIIQGAIDIWEWLK